MKYVFSNVFVFFLGICVTACSTHRADQGLPTSAMFVLLKESDVIAFKERAMHGDAEAAMRLSAHYEELGDESAYLGWLYIAATQNVGRAQYNLGYYNAHIYKNIPLARFWLQEASKNGMKREAESLLEELDGK